MFETSVVKAHAIAARRRAGLFTMSIGFHSMIAVAAIAMTVQTSRFPNNAPRQMASFSDIMPAVEPPLPKGNPEAPRTPDPKPQQPAQPQQQTAPQVPQQETAPNPNQVPDHATQLTSDGNSNPGTATPGTEPWGVPDGKKGGLDIGQVPQTHAEPPVYKPVGDVHAARVLTRVEPVYPRLALTNRVGGVVKLQCIIDKNGNISAPEIVFSSFAAFNQPVLDALRRWTFAPGTLHGEPVDTYFELTITFQPK